MSSENNTNWGSRPNTTQNIVANGGKKRPVRLPPEEIARRKRLAEEAKRQRKETFFARLIFGTAIYMVCCLLIVAFVAALYLPDAKAEGIALTIHSPEGAVLYNQSEGRSYINGTRYVSAAGLSKLYDFTLAGDKNQVTLHFHNIGQSLSLYKDSSAVVINGSTVRLSAPIIFTDDYYIPLELIRYYFYGVIIKYDSAKDVTVLSRQAGDDSFTLNLHAPEITLPVSRD